MSLLNDASLVFIPSGYKEDKVYSVIPSNGAGDLDFVRGCDATRINPQSLVENTPWNLLNYSEDFSNAVWQPSGASVTTNQTTAPNGTNTGDKFLIDTSNSEHVIYNSSPYQSVLGQYTTSVYLKYGNTNFIEVANNGANGANYCYIIVNLTNGAVTQSGNSGSYTLNSYDVTSVGDGWYRCSITYTVTSDEIRGLRVRFSNSATPTVTTYGSIVYTGNGTDFVYAWGAQLNIGAIKPYFPTTDRLNVPRLDYTNSTCPSLLLEKQSTNLALYSEQFDNVSWTVFNGTITANSTISPDGTFTADKITMGGAGSATLRQMISGVTNGTIVTFSLYIKQGIGVTAFLDISDTKGTVDITPTENWVRYTYSIAFNILLPFIDIELRGTSGVSFCYIWGAQLEASSYATSYIPTTSATVTRLADSCSKTGISSLIGQTEGTMFVDYNYDAKPDVSGNIPMIIYNGSNEAYIYITNGADIRLELYNAGVLQCLLTTSIGAVGRKKIAFAYKQNDFIGYMNGVQIAADTSGTVGGMSNLYLGSYYTANYNVNGGINQALLFKRRLTNTELANLTTL